MNSYVTGRLEPALTILLDIPCEISLARRNQAGDLNRFDQDEINFHQRVNQRFREMAERKNWIVINSC